MQHQLSLFEPDQLQDTNLYIPKIIHFIWISNDPIPTKYQAAVKSFKYLNPDFEVKLWRGQDFIGWKTMHKSIFPTLKSYAAISDYLRFEIIYKYGGIYADIDTFCVRPLDFLSGLKFFAAKECLRTLTAHFFGAEPRNEIIGTAIELLPQYCQQHHYYKFVELRAASRVSFDKFIALLSYYNSNKNPNEFASDYVGLIGESNFSNLTNQTKTIKLPKLSRFNTISNLNPAPSPLCLRVAFDKVTNQPNPFVISNHHPYYKALPRRKFDTNFSFVSKYLNQFLKADADFTQLVDLYKSGIFGDSYTYNMSMGSWTSKKKNEQFVYNSLAKFEDFIEIKSLSEY